MLHLSENKKIRFLKNIDFGDIDANADPNLEDYFIDMDYWNEIIENPIFYVIGKKGTGKSAIYQYLFKQSSLKGAIFENADFTSFPFEKLVRLSDDDFSRPNQYRSIWQHIIIDFLIPLIIKNQAADTNIYYERLKDYYDLFLKDSINLHYDSISRVEKEGFGLTLKYSGIEPSLNSEKQTGFNLIDSAHNITAINKSLWDLITNYLISRSDNTTYIIQFDRLDDTYNQCRKDIETYFQVIISLMKTVYDLNCSLRTKGISNVKVVAYLRNDINNELAKRDAESARWDAYTYKINWAIINQNDWVNPPLLQLINKRISHSLQSDITFNDIFDSNKINMRNYNPDTGRIGREVIDVFKYIVDKTFHRPRDLIQFCRYIAIEIRNTENCIKIDFRNIKNAEKNYCNWLVNSEIANEINPIITDIDNLYDFIRSLGGRQFSFSVFCSKFKVSSVGRDTSIKANNLLDYLYEVGIILNVYRERSGSLRFRSIIRNDGKINKDMLIMVHPGIWKGLTS